MVDELQRISDAGYKASYPTKRQSVEESELEQAGNDIAAGNIAKVVKDGNTNLGDELKKIQE